MLRCGSFSKLILRLWMYVARWFQQVVVLFQTTVCLMINCGHASLFLLPVGSVGIIAWLQMEVTSLCMNMDI